jgi:hypothetical protein
MAGKFSNLRLPRFGKGLVISALLLPVLPCVAGANPYVPGMSCDQVGDFAAAVVVAKAEGDSAKQQISDMRQSIGQYPETQRGLARIISAIYDKRDLRAASPDAAQGAYKRACELWEHR